MLNQNVDRLEQDLNRYTKQKQTKASETKQNKAKQLYSTARIKNGKHYRKLQSENISRR